MREQYEQTQELLEVKLEERPNKNELIARNILKEELDGNVAASIQGVQQRLKFNRKVVELNVKLEHRPERLSLVVNNILKEDTVASGKFRNRISVMDEKFSHRPLVVELIEHNIMKAGAEVAANLQGTQQTLKFQTIVATLDHKLEHRPSAQDLVDHNIIKDVTDMFYMYRDMLMAHYKYSDSLSFADTVAKLEPQLEHRPPLLELMNLNILKGSMSTSLHTIQLVFSKWN